MPGHQLGIIADPVDELVKEHVLRLLTTPSVREALLAQAGQGDDGTMGRTLADLGAAQTRLQGLDDFYVRGVLAEGRYRSIRVKLEREIDRLHAVVDAGWGLIFLEVAAVVLAFILFRREQGRADSSESTESPE